MLLNHYLYLVSFILTMCVHKNVSTNNDFEVSLNDECDYIDIENAIDSDSGDLTIIQHNIRGLNSKLGDLSHLLNNVQKTGHPNVLLLCESWLKSSSPKPILDGYSIERNDRKWKKGGGVCICISDRCKYSRRRDLEAYNCDSFEACFVEVQSWNLKLVIGCVYRPPNTNINKFTESLEKVCTVAKRHGRRLILGMDHNLDLLKESQHKPTHDFMEKIYENEMVPTITKPTRITKKHSDTNRQHIPGSTADPHQQ